MFLASFVRGLRAKEAANPGTARAHESVTLYLILQRPIYMSGKRKLSKPCFECAPLVYVSSVRV